MRRVGIVGCGTIGSALAQVIERDYADAACVVALADLRRSQALKLRGQLASRPPIVGLSELIKRSELVIEAASVSVAARVACLALAAQRDVLIMSTGGLLANRAAWQRLMRRSRAHLYVPSGALCGVDGIKAMAVGRIQKISLTTRKPPGALASSPFVQTKRLRLDRLRRPKLLFEGPPSEVVKAFPQNTNVAATMSLACLGWNASSKRQEAVPATVRVVADPSIARNIHELEILGDTGRIHVRVESDPAPRNPKTSELAVRSAIAALRGILEPVRIGT